MLSSVSAHAAAPCAAAHAPPCALAANICWNICAGGTPCASALPIACRTGGGSCCNACTTAAATCIPPPACGAPGCGTGLAGCHQGGGAPPGCSQVHHLAVTAPSSATSAAMLSQSSLLMMKSSNASLSIFSDTFSALAGAALHILRHHLTDLHCLLLLLLCGQLLCATTNHLHTEYAGSPEVVEWSPELHSHPAR